MGAGPPVSRGGIEPRSLVIANIAADCLTRMIYKLRECPANFGRERCCVKSKLARERSDCNSVTETGRNPRTCHATDKPL